jgi:hypothetical protein
MDDTLTLATRRLWAEDPDGWVGEHTDAFRASFPPKSGDIDDALASM